MVSARRDNNTHCRHSQNGERAPDSVNTFVARSVGRDTSHLDFLRLAGVAVTIYRVDDDKV